MNTVTASIPVEVEIRGSDIHGRGAFAVSGMGARTRIMEYVGEAISAEECRQRCAAGNRFIFTLDDAHFIDGAVGWNPARWLNHSCAPNCEANRVGGRIWIVARRFISAGEELTFNYGFDLEDYEEFPCACEAPGCVEFIVAEEYFDRVRREKLGGQAGGSAHERNGGVTLTAASPSGIAGDHKAGR